MAWDGGMLGVDGLDFIVGFGFLLSLVFVGEPEYVCLYGVLDCQK